MVFKLIDGYEKASSNNLPRVDVIMMANFFSSTEKFIQPEIKNVKSSRNMRPEYGDAAIGYVQVMRKGTLVHVKAAVCPETWTRKSSYNLDITLDSKSILRAECLDCKASRGGCKHAIAFIAWLHRRSEEPSPTETVCYWRKSTLSRVGTTLKFITASEIAGEPAESSEEVEEDRESCTFLNEIIDILNEESCDSSNALKQLNSPLTGLSMHSLLHNFVKNGGSDFDDFLVFVSSELKKANLQNICEETISQFECVLWKELRYARITASQLHTVAKCLTPYGSTTKLLLGAIKIKDNKYMLRGRNLEPEILKVVEKSLGVKIGKVGLVLNENYPIFGASPDGVTKNFVVEVKAPFHTKTFKNYLSEKQEPTIRYKLQILLQMALCQKNFGYFCVADANFESNKKVTIVKVVRDDSFLEPFLKDAQLFWKQNVFEKLLKGALYANV